MPLRDILVLGLIVIVFAAFGIVLGSVSWYCRGSATRLPRRAAGRRADDPKGGGIITDDD